LRVLCLLTASPRCVDPAEGIEALAVAAIQCKAGTDKSKGQWLWIVDGKAVPEHSGCNALLGYVRNRGRNGCGLHDALVIPGPADYAI
jgi:hypothetical protein